MARIKNIPTIRLFYTLFVVAFFLKFVGSYWDASYHFKYLFEKYSIPHLVNFSGFLLGAYLLFTEWKKPTHMDKLSRNIVTIGYIAFLVGIPLDFTYHIAFGIDLTTWSPTHFIYYLATATMILGVWRGYTLTHPGVFHILRSHHTWFAMFFLECFLFPNMQQENGAISYDQYIHGESIASKEILSLLSDPSSQIFGGIPPWIYPVYSVFILCLFIFSVFRILKNRYLPLSALALYLILRFIGKGIFFSVHYPTSYVPITLLLIPVFFILFRQSFLWTGVLGSLFYFLAFYGIQQSGWMITPPLESWEAIPVAIGGLIAAGAIHFIFRLIENRHSKVS